MVCTARLPRVPDSTTSYTGRRSQITGSSGPPFSQMLSFRHADNTSDYFTELMKGLHNVNKSSLYKNDLNILTIHSTKDTVNNSIIQLSLLRSNN